MHHTTCTGCSRVELGRGWLCTYSPAYLKRSVRATRSWMPEMAAAPTQMATNMSFVRSFVNLLSSGCMTALYLDTDQNIRCYYRHQNIHETYYKPDVNSLLSFIFSTEQSLKIDIKVQVIALDVKVDIFCSSYKKELFFIRLINNSMQPKLLIE